MLKIVSSPADLKGLDVSQFYTVRRGDDLLAVASTAEEAKDAQEILIDLTRAQINISPPRALQN